MRKLLTDLKFWSLAISVVALMLSQLPPIKNWIAHISIESKIGEQVGISNQFGIIDIGAQVFLTNTGNRELSVSRIELLLHSPSKKEVLLGGGWYSQSNEDGAQVAYPVGVVDLKPGETWAKYVNFYRDRTPSTLEKLQAVQLAISEDLLRIRRTSPDAVLVEASPESVKAATDWYASNFDLEKGDYYLTFRFIGSTGQILAQNRLRMPVYDYQLALIKSQVDDYKYGYGVVLPTLQHKNLFGQLYLDGVK